MSHQHQVTESQPSTETSRGHYVLEFLGIVSFFVLALLMGAEIYRGMVTFGFVWLLPIIAHSPNPLPNRGTLVPTVAVHAHSR